MIVCIAVTALLKHDAIGNDVCHQCVVLNDHHIPAVVYAGEVGDVPITAYCIDQAECRAIIDHPDNLLIYHHGGCWAEGRRLLEKARCRVFVKYHNVTPPEFFSSYSAVYERFCSEGVAQTRLIAGMDHITKFLCASSFNAGDLLRLNVSPAKIEISPPFNKLNDFNRAEIDPVLSRELQDGKVNILFVGRVAPNKGHKEMIRVAAEYAATYGAAIRFNMVGGIDPELAGYRNELDRLIDAHSLKEIVTLTGAVSFDRLHTYYRYSHLFLLMSAHEGFCLPAIEAQFHRLPVVALDSSAIPETLGPNQLVFETPDPLKFAAAIHVLSHHDAYRAYLADEGRKNLRRFLTPGMEAAFFNALGLTALISNT
ncbi:MAG: glycosyltransferase [Desulfobacterales bacterium]|jgi:glycosyltransferase involved in cell wall biosynthesis|nr:glycosyltransferase [Desulfobacterales bacterium]